MAGAEGRLFVVGLLFSPWIFPKGGRVLPQDGAPRTARARGPNPAPTHGADPRPCPTSCWRFQPPEYIFFFFFSPWSIRAEQNFPILRPGVLSSTRSLLAQRELRRVTHSCSLLRFSAPHSEFLGVGSAARPPHPLHPNPGSWMQLRVPAQRSSRFRFLVTESWGCTRGC